MRRLRLLVACMVTMSLTSASALPGAAAEADADADAPDHVVHAGAKDPTDPLSLHMYEGYFPRHLRVHKGDRVRWEFPNQGHFDQAFHTVTFGDADEVPLVRADEVPGLLAFDERSFFTTGCGRAGQPVCVISSSDQFVSSGTPLQHMAGVGQIQPFDAVIDLPPGTYDYFCTLHHPAMKGTIEVVDDDVTVDNPKPEAFAGEIAALATKADATFAGLSQPTLSNEGGRRVWTVHTGARTDDDIPVSAEAFLPSSLEIRAGDTVRWVMGGTAHTVTFPDTSTGKGPPQYMTLNCELDQPATGAPGVPAIATVGAFGLPWCPPGATAELLLTALGTDQQRAPRDQVVSPATVHNSGIMIDGALPERMRGRPPGSGEHFPSQFEATFPVPGTYAYRCLIHWEFMSGSITVTGG
jgi:plastocyanin